MCFRDIYEHTFLDYISRPLHIIIQEHNKDIYSLKESLKKIHFKVIGESYKYFEEEKKNNPISLKVTFSDMLEKTKTVFKDLFEERKDGLYYINKGVNLRINTGDTIGNKFATVIFENYQKNEKLMMTRVKEVEAMQEGKWVNNSIPPKTEVRKTRIPKRQSFELKNPDVNLQLVRKILLEGKFIKEISNDNFSQAFSGNPVSQKIIWNNANALQYFIQKIIEGGGVINPNEGKWKRSIKCFRLQNRELKIPDLKDTKAPVGSKTNMLDLAIEEINRK